jgi:phosphoglucosamine mutase
MDRVVSLVTERYDASSITTLDGVRIETKTGWMLIRASGTQPLVRLTAEARTDDDVERLLAEAENLVATARSER